MSGSWRAGTQEGLARAGGQALTWALWLQPVLRGPSGRAARRSVSASRGTRLRVTGETAAVPAKRASGASGVRTVSAGGAGGGGGKGPSLADPAGPSLLAPLQSASQASLGRGACRHVPALRAWPVTPSAASVGSSVPPATGGRTVTKVSGQPEGRPGLGRVGVTCLCRALGPRSDGSRRWSEAASLAPWHLHLPWPRPGHAGVTRHWSAGPGAPVRAAGEGVSLCSGPGPGKGSAPPLVS